jgi:hypothetical protein
MLNYIKKATAPTMQQSLEVSFEKWIKVSCSSFEF